jgi:hypothetical protein
MTRRSYLMKSVIHVTELIHVGGQGLRLHLGESLQRFRAHGPDDLEVFFVHALLLFDTRF